MIKYELLKRLLNIMEANVVTRKATILKMVKGARLEIVIRNKKISASDEELVQKVMDKFQKEDDDFAAESRRLCHWDSVIRDVVWLEANMEESKMIIDRLKSGDESFANDFFYDDDRTGCNISRIRSKILSFIKQTYKVDVSSDEFGNILYAFLWNGGTWSVLDSYSCKSSFFCWLEEIARHELIRYLKDMNIIKVKSERTAGNTRMLGMSVLPETWERVLADTMPDGFHKKLLFDILVKRKTKEAMEVEYGVDADDLHRLQKRAEADFKDRLIRSNSVYEDLVLRDKCVRREEVSEDFVKDIYVWQEDNSNANPLADVLGVGLDNEELHEKVKDFLYSFPKMLNWTEEERLVWTLRFIENTAPVEVAERIGRRRSWVDTKYSRLNARFNKAVREWWFRNAV